MKREVRPETPDPAAARGVAPPARVPLAVRLDVSPDMPATYRFELFRTYGTISRPSRRKSFPGAPLGRFLLTLVLLIGLSGPAAGASYKLVAWSGSLPSDAVLAGDDRGAPLYVCVAESWGGEHPGKLDERGVCHVAWGGQEHTFTQGFRVLVGPGNAVWAELSNGTVASAFAAGGDDGGPIHVCRVSLASGVYPGKLVDGWCYVANDGEEHYFTDGYEVLVEK